MVHESQGISYEGNWKSGVRQGYGVQKKRVEVKKTDGNMEIVWVVEAQGIYENN